MDASPAEETWRVAVEIARRWLAGEKPPNGLAHARDVIDAIRAEMRTAAKRDACGAERVFDRIGEQLELDPLDPRRIMQAFPL